MSIKLTKISFDEIGFRKLKNLTIEIAPRITAISGHNAIGKSTILGLIANCSGSKESSILGKQFKAELSELFFLDYQKDYLPYEKLKPYPIKLTYKINDYDFIKQCKISTSAAKIKKLKPFIKKVEKNNSEEPVNEYYRLRFVPRTCKPTAGSDDFNVFETICKDYQITDSAKVPIPTLYIGMSRMAPIGEFSIEHINSINKSKTEKTKQYILDKFNSVLSSEQGIDTVTHDFTHSKKKSMAPQFKEYSSLAISLGQDSLSSIITALASFNNLKEKLNENNTPYIGGILIIDEIESGLHPKAQEKLIRLLQKEAKNLELQIIITTHSLTVLKTIMVGGNGDDINNKDDIVHYLIDTKVPHLLESPTYLKIKNDMLLIPYITPKGKLYPIVKAYFEDDEAAILMQSILNEYKIQSVDKYGVDLKLVPAALGCNNLASLLSKDFDYFGKCLIILDADYEPENEKQKQKDKQSPKHTIMCNYQNIILLPGVVMLSNQNSESKLSPEKILYYFLKNKYDNYETENVFWDKSTPDWFTTDYVQEYFLTKINPKNWDRSILKKWFKDNQKSIIEAHLFELWAKEHNSEVNEFLKQIERVISSIAK